MSTGEAAVNTQKRRPEKRDGVFMSKRSKVTTADYPGRYLAVDAESLEINRLLRATDASLADAFKRCLNAADFWGTYTRYQILRNLEFADGQLPQSELSRRMDVTSGNLS